MVFLNKPLTKAADYSAVEAIDRRRTSIAKQPIFSVINDHLIEYPTPANLNYWWGFGS